MTALPPMFEDFLESTPDPGIVVDADGAIVAMNRELTSLLGYSREQLLGRPVEMLLPLGKRAVHVGARAEFHRHPQIRAMGAARTLEAVHRDGSSIPVEIALAPVAATTSLVWAAVRDVRSRMQSEARLLRLAAVVGSTDDAVIAKTLDAVITDWNHGAERLYGYAAAEVIGKHLDVIVPPDRRPEISAILAGIARGERVKGFDTLRRHRDGRLIPVALTVSPIVDAAGRLVGASTIARDLSDRLAADRLREEVVAGERRRRQAVELNDNVLQHLVVVQTQLARGDVPSATAAVTTALLEARRLIDELLGEGSLRPEDLTRSFARDPQVIDVEDSRNGQDPTRVEVLITDDDPMVRRLLAAILVEAGEFTVVGQASDGQESIDRAREYQPDLVLLDVSMPGMDGLTALPLIRQVAPRAFVVVLSAFDAARMAREASAVGADAYIEKGDLATGLVPRLRTLLADRR